jgi:hypothetical protein
MGAMIEQIWSQDKGTSEKLAVQIWPCSADHHTGRRLLKVPQIKKA